MKIRFEYVSRSGASAEYRPHGCGGGADVIARFAEPVADREFRLPECSMPFCDMLRLSSGMIPGKEYDCVLEAGSFRTVRLYTDCERSVRGRFYGGLPERYCLGHALFKNRQCMEINGDFILLSPHNDLGSESLSDGCLIEIIPQEPIYLRSAVRSF